MNKLYYLFYPFLKFFFCYDIMNEEPPLRESLAHSDKLTALTPPKNRF